MTLFSRRHASLAAPVFALSLSTALRLGLDWEARLQRPLAGGMATFEQGAGTGSPPYQRITKGAQGYDIKYGFINFNGDRLSVELRAPNEAVRIVDSTFGYTEKDLDDIFAWKKKALKDAYADIVRRGGGQADVDRAAAQLEREYKKKVAAYMASRGFKMLEGNVVAVDMPALVRIHKGALGSLAKTFEQISSQRGYGFDELVGAVTSMAQTSLEYRIPPPNEGSRRIGGVLPPLKSLIYGWGDCDTKTGIVAAVLSNWPDLRVLGIGLPGHYLAGYQRQPAKGDVFVEWDNEPYVLLEPAGPAWLAPGQVGSETLAMLEGRELEIEPFF